MDPLASKDNSKAPWTCLGRFPRTKSTLSAQPPPSMRALWRSHFQERQYSFLLRLPPAPGPQQSQVCWMAQRDHTASPPDAQPSAAPLQLPPLAALFRFASLRLDTAENTNFPVPAQISAEFSPTASITHIYAVPQLLCAQPWSILRASQRPLPQCHAAVPTAGT